MPTGNHPAPFAKRIVDARTRVAFTLATRRDGHYPEASPTAPVPSGCLPGKPITGLCERSDGNLLLTQYLVFAPTMNPR